MPYALRATEVREVSPEGRLAVLPPPLPADSPDAVEDALDRIARQVQHGVRPEQVLDLVFQGFRGLIPFDRLACALLDPGGASVRAFWARSEGPGRASPFLAGDRLEVGYALPLAGSSLAPVLASEEPRILGDLEAYLLAHPGSDSTRRIVAEGMRSSLTCPLVSFQGPLGFLFFSSRRKHAYTPSHTRFFRRIADQVAGALEKARMLDELSRLDRDRTRLLQTVAHDLRSPLDVIQGIARLLDKEKYGPVTARQRELIEGIRHESARILSLAQDLTDLEAAGEGRLQVSFEPVDLAALVRRRVEAFATAAADKGIRIEPALPDRLPIQGSPGRLSQVLDNLLSNALKYSPQGALVRVEATRHAAGAQVAIVDEGPGIPSAELGLLFTEFGRTSVRPTAGEPTTGLGLSIVRRLVEVHGGTVGCDSQVGVGSRFWFRIPLAGA